jgi:hypothetical protein
MRHPDRDDQGALLADPPQFDPKAPAWEVDHLAFTIAGTLKAMKERL